VIKGDCIYIGSSNHPVGTAGSARGFRTSSLLTLRWREMD
jgi:hypothetical protein